MAAYSQHTLSGVVVDEKSQPLPGANLVIEELNRGTVTSEMELSLLMSIPAGSTP